MHHSASEPEPRSPSSEVEPPRSTSAPSEPLFTRAFLLLVATQMSYGFVSSELLLLPKFLARELAASPDTIGWVMAAGVAGGVLFVPMAGSLLDGQRRGRLTIIGGLAGALGSLGLLAVRSPGPLLFALALVLSMAFVLVFNASGTMVADLAPRSRLGQALGLWGLATLVTNAIAPVVLEPLADAYGWGPVFIVGSVCGLVAAGLGALVARQEPTPASPPQPRASALRFRGPRGRIFFAASLTGLGLGALFTFVVPYALEMGATRVRSFFVGYTIAAVAVRVCFGGLADRYGRARVSFVALIGYGVAVAAAAFVTPSSLPLVGAGLGIAHGLTYPSLNALAVADERRAARGSAMAYFYGAHSLGRSVGVAALGLLANSVGYPSTFIVAGTCVAVGSLILAPLIGDESRSAELVRRTRTS